MYKCAICNKEYPTIKDRSVCEAKCVAEAEKAAADLKKQKLDEEKKTRYNEVIEAMEHYYDLIKKYTSDYGTIQIDRNWYFEDDIVTGNKRPLGWWF